ncbi:hypothetical protein L209DRAFT_31633 [Thermothelomyces heterothallicus CBS 203.75]
MGCLLGFPYILLYPLALVLTWFGMLLSVYRLISGNFEREERLKHGRTRLLGLDSYRLFQLQSRTMTYMTNPATKGYKRGREQSGPKG